MAITTNINKEIEPNAKNNDHAEQSEIGTKTVEEQ